MVLSSRLKSTSCFVVQPSRLLGAGGTPAPQVVAGHPLSSKHSIDVFLLRVVDCGLAGAVFAVPLLMGGRHPAGQLVLTVCAVAAAWAWSLRQCHRHDNAWRPTAALPLLLLGALLLVVQAVPLPAGLPSKLAPRAAEVLPLWSAGDGPARFGSWSYISFTPAETLAALVIFLDYALLFLVAVQRIRLIEDVERLLRWCALSAVIMAVVGLLQLLFGNGKFLWFYEHPLSLASGVAKGTFTNRNHFAQFLALGLGPLIWWLQDSMRRSHGLDTKKGRLPASGVSRGELRTYMLALALGLVLFAGLLSLSRGGIAAMFLAALICTAVCYRTVSFGGRLLAGLALSIALIAAGLGIFGYERVSHRLESLTSGSLDQVDESAGRRTIWTATIAAAADYLPMGTGAGSFQRIYPMYTDLNSDAQIESTNAENSYLQEILETGVLGAVLLLAGIGLCVYWCVGGVWSSAPPRYKVAAGAIAASLAASMAHAVVDFIWYVPACMAMAVILAACAQRMWQLSRGQRAEARSQRSEVGGRGSVVSERGAAVGPAPSNLSSLFPLPSSLFQRLAWPAVAVGLTILGGWMIANRFGPTMAQAYWDEYMVARNVQHVRPDMPDDPDNADAGVQRRWVACLEKVVRWSPSHIKAHLALAEAYRRLFDALQANSENRMSLAHIRDAALQSRFPSGAALDEWLSRAVGAHWVLLRQCLDQTRQALALSPLEGRAYVYMSELSFLCGNRDVRHVYLQQALRVRPYDGAVLEAAASEALLAGDVRGWLEYARRAFRSGPRRQRQIIGELISATAPQNVPAVADYVIRELQPDLDGLRALHAECLKHCPAGQLESLARRRAIKVEEEAAKADQAKAAALWLEARSLHAQLDDGADALRCGRNALKSDPNSFDAHYAYGLDLLKARSFAEAEKYLTWCRQRRPHDPNVESKLREALKGRLDARRAAAESDKLR